MLTKRNAIPVTEAQNKIQQLKLPHLTDNISIEEASHRILAEDVKAIYPYPHFRRAGMDGYAILASDDHDFPKDFKVLGEVQAGAVFDGELKPGQTVRIMTGACVPDEAGKVIRIEKTERHGNSTVTIKDTERKSNITEIGTDFKKGQVIMSANQEINPGGLAVLRAFGINQVKVYRRPKVAIIATGTELLKPEQKIAKGKIYNSNSLMLKNLVEESGGVIDFETQLVDDKDALISTLKKVIPTHDLVITDGGVSVGDFDYMGELALHSDQLLFNKVQQRPGSVTTAFIKDQTFVMALSGNPGACYVGFYLYVEPFLRRFVNMPSRSRKVTGILAAPFNKTNDFNRYVRSTYQIKNGQYMIYPNGINRSGSLANLQTTTCLYIMPGGKKAVQPGNKVQAWLLPFK